VETGDAHALARALQAAAGQRLAEAAPVPDGAGLLDALVTEPDLRAVVRQVFLNGHYGLAVEEGFKYLNNLVKRRSGLEADGSSLMGSAFSMHSPVLKLNDLRTQSKKDQQLGYMQILQGSMTGIRNPRAHEHKYLDEPRNAIELLALCNHLVRLVTNANRARSRRTP